MSSKSNRRLDGAEAVELELLLELSEPLWDCCEVFKISGKIVVTKSDGASGFNVRCEAASEVEALVEVELRFADGVQD